MCRRRIRIWFFGDTVFYNQDHSFPKKAKSTLRVGGNLPVKFLCAAPSQAAIPATYPIIRIENYRYLKSHATQNLALIFPYKLISYYDRVITFATRPTKCKPACGAATFGERLSLAANSISKNITRPLVATRFEGAYHFWRVNRLLRREKALRSPLGCIKAL